MEILESSRSALQNAGVTFSPGALVLYKQKPARISQLQGEKIEIETSSGSVRVRPKDITVLHPGPTPTPLGSLATPEADPRDVWELVDGETMPLSDLADLAFGAFTATSALGVWRWVQDGTFFTGTPDAVTPRSAQAVQATLDAREAQAEEARAWDAFIEALSRGEVLDPRRLTEVEALALGRQRESRVLAALGRPETPEQAHALLLALGTWTPERNPYPTRHAVDPRPSTLHVPQIPPEKRLDLTHLPAYAIDDEGSSDPDDAISLESTPDGYRLWVHVSDVATLVPPDAELDREARRRGATLYLPEGTSPMLPPETTATLGLGLHDVSPALSFAIPLTLDFQPLDDVEVHPSLVRVTRLTYADAQAQLDRPDLAPLAQFARAARARREAAGAVLLDLPEVRIRLHDGDIRITPLPPLESRVVVQEAMMLAGWAAATWAAARDLPLPFAQQDPPLDRIEGDDLPTAWARRRTLARTRFAPVPGPHAGLGLERYAQATSPMRRYLDLVVHQQLRAAIRDERTLSGRDIAARVAEADLGAGSVRAAERASNRHWTLVYLQRHPGWRGEGVVVDRRGAGATILIPEIALDVVVTTPYEIGSRLEVEVVEVGLAELSVRVRVLGEL